MRWILVASEARPEEASTFPKPVEILSGMGIVLAVHLAIALAVVVGLRALGIA